jgi:hypothetical protein
VATALAFVFAYCTQLALYNEEIGIRDGGRMRWRHPIILWIGVGLALIAVFEIAGPFMDVSAALSTFSLRPAEIDIPPASEPDSRAG